MNAIIVVNNPHRWSLEISGAEVVAARSYLTDSAYSERRGCRVYNLCRNYHYQSLGYYVSLLAEARGQKPLPTISTVQDLKGVAMARVVSDELQELIQRSLAPLVSDAFVLSVYFGRNVARRYDRLSAQLFKMFPAPLLRAYFAREDGSWEMHNIESIPASEVLEEHRDFIAEAARDHLARGHTPPRRRPARYDLALLYNHEEREPPSDAKAVQRFLRAAEKVGMSAEVIEREDYGRLAEFDALFIRETTGVNHHTYRFARRAAAEGLVVIDDPVSILRCCNKVYLAELLEHQRIPTPRTVIVHRDNVDLIQGKLGLPCILKQPDSYFSKGVVKVERPAELEEEVRRLLERSELVIAQEFVPTEFDWRIGVLDRQPLFACKYFMAHEHWQIVKRDGAEITSFGRAESVPVEFAPSHVMKMALRAANLIGEGFYGVDVKEQGERCCVIEVNDNPTVEAGIEDSVRKEELYLTVMRVLLSRIERLKDRGAGR
ncbi:MAG: RimK family protein [Planctomycetes bacterium]|nr:RimK family protein [Planctomycetota bacterium]